MRFALRPLVVEGELKQACNPTRPVESKLNNFEMIKKFHFQNQTLRWFAQFSKIINSRSSVRNSNANQIRTAWTHIQSATRATTINQNIILNQITVTYSKIDGLRIKAAGISLHI